MNTSHNSSHQNDSLDSLFSRLRESEPYIADNGFTNSVMAMLPAHREIPAWQKRVVIALFSLIGTILAVVNIPIESLPIANILQSLQSGSTGFFLLAIAAVSVIGLSGATLWASHKELI